jgi:hypothetical protein
MLTDWLPVTGTCVGVSGSGGDEFVGGGTSATGFCVGLVVVVTGEVGVFPPLQPYTATPHPNRSVNPSTAGWGRRDIL